MAEHGPLSIELLHRMTLPPSRKVNIRQSLGILKKKGLVDSATLNSHQTFYYLAQSQNDREDVSKAIGRARTELELPLLRKRDWIHNQWREYWICMLKRLFPESKIIHEDTIGSNQLARDILLLKVRDFDVMPDFLLILPKTETTEMTSIAFEIERTRKSDKRLMMKFEKYLNRTKLDGLIYICDSGRLSESIRLLYQNRLLAKAHRVKHYGSHFFLFSDSMAGGGPNLDRLMNANAEPVQLETWCHTLQNTTWTRRRDVDFVWY